MLALLAPLLLTASLTAEPPGAPEPSGDAPVTTSPPVVADPTAAPVDPRAHEAIAFADHLFVDGDWYRAITEYRRYLFLVRGRGPGAPRAALAIGEALLRGEQWDAAGRQLDGVAQRAGDIDLRRIALFGAARAYLLDGRAELAKPRFRLLADDDGTPQRLRTEALWLLGWGHFDAGELALAAERFAAVANGDSPHAADARGLVAALGTGADVELKDPLLAGALSLLPGMGHFYLEQWSVGVTSLVWNALFITASVAAWIAGEWGTALVLTVFELGWYGGGIFGAVSGAYKYNRDAVRNWRDDILTRYGQSRELPEAQSFKGSPDALPGTLLRFGGAF